MNKFNWDEFKKGKFAVHVKSQEEFNKFIELSNDNDIVGLDSNNYIITKEKTCIDCEVIIDKYKNKCVLHFASFDYYKKKEKIPIIEFIDVLLSIKQKKLADYTNEELLEELNKRLINKN